MSLAFVRALGRLGFIGREPAAQELIDRTLIDSVQPQPGRSQRCGG